MSAQHTPGPWEVGLSFKTGGRYPAYIVTDNEFIAAIYSGPTYATLQAAHQNARLIAAAPELLAALQQARSALAAAIRSAWEGSTDDDIREHVVIKQIDAAIAKAGGAS